MKNNVICIDESGITSKNGHSTFAFVYLEFENIKDIDGEIKKIEKDLHINFIHWSEMSWALREKVSLRISKLDFKCRVAVFKNPIDIDSSLLLACKYLILSEDKISSIYIDGDKPNKFINKIKNILRSKNMDVKSIKTVSDKKLSGLRLADFVAGAIRYHFDNQDSDKNVVYQRIKNKISVSHIQE